MIKSGMKDKVLIEKIKKILYNIYVIKVKELINMLPFLNFIALLAVIFLTFMFLVIIPFKELCAMSESRNTIFIRTYLEQHKGQKIMAEIISAETGIAYSDVVEVLSDLRAKREKKVCEDGVKRYVYWY